MTLFIKQREAEKAAAAKTTKGALEAKPGGVAVGAMGAGRSIHIIATGKMAKVDNKSILDISQPVSL